MNQPTWLPDFIETNGVWDEVVQRLYCVFERDFKTGRPKWRGLEVWWDSRRDKGDDYERGFWHLITFTDQATKERLPDFRRAERLGWCAPTIVHCPDSAVLEWVYIEGNGDIRNYLWLKDLDYVVIVEKKARTDRNTGTWYEITMLITAFYLDGDGSRRRMKKKYEQRQTP
jgi:hypothetical protein